MSTAPAIRGSVQTPGITLPGMPMLVYLGVAVSLATVQFVSAG
ncbi:MAG: hypothetical protein ABSD32_20600 [Mycobacterium sp.]